MTSRLREPRTLKGKIATLSVTGGVAFGAVAIGIITRNDEPKVSTRSTVVSSPTSETVAGSVDTSVLAAFPKEIPTPSEGLAAASANPPTVDGGSDSKPASYSLTYYGTDLSKLLEDLRTKFVGAGYAISHAYEGKVRNVPSGGFVATSKQWVATVGGTLDGGRAVVSVTVAAI